LWNRGLNSGLCTCKAGILLLELHYISSPFCSDFFARAGLELRFS
jgi:hypothetical protein